MRAQRSAYQCAILHCLFGLSICDSRALNSSGEVSKSHPLVFSRTRSSVQLGILLKRVNSYPRTCL